jgi:hypothetical protein
VTAGVNVRVLLDDGDSEVLPPTNCLRPVRDHHCVLFDRFMLYYNSLNQSAQSHLVLDAGKYDLHLSSALSDTTKDHKNLL